MNRTRWTTAAVVGSASLALVLAGCGGSDDGDNGGSAPAGDLPPLSEGPGDEEVTVRVATFNQFGYTDELLQEYMDMYPNVTIVQSKAATTDEARENFFTKLGSQGLADVEAVEVDWFADTMQYSDLLADLSDPDVENRWLDWKSEAATDADGRLIGYGTDIGPAAVCFRKDLLEEAGLPSDREEFAEYINGDWDKYFEAGKEYADATGKAWFDDAGALFQGRANQMPAAFEDPGTGDIVATSNPEVKEAYDQILAAAADQSAHLRQWSDDWYAGMANGDFATMLCPGWMLGVIEGAAAKVDGWDVANVFPGGGGNWGGSYLTVPTQGQNQQAAKHVAAWLTAPEQQLKAYQNAGTFPSQVEALASEELLSATNAFFNDAPTGEILSARADAVTVTPYKGPQYFPVMTAMQNAIARVEDGTQSAEQSWGQFEKDVTALK